MVSLRPKNRMIVSEKVAIEPRIELRLGTCMTSMPKIYAHFFQSRTCAATANSASAKRCGELRYDLDTSCAASRSTASVRAARRPSAWPICEQLSELQHGLHLLQGELQRAHCMQAAQQATVLAAYELRSELQYGLSESCEASCSEMCKPAAWQAECERL